MVSEENVLKEEWTEKFDVLTGKLKADLSHECYEWAKNHNEETNKLERELTQQKLRECYEKIREIINSYMDIPKDKSQIISLWIIGTYIHNSFETYPFLFLNAMRGSGKTRLLRIISHLSKGGNGQVQTGLTESVLFRMPKGRTLILDEMESIGSKEKQTLREYLNACYKKGGVVQRSKKVKYGNSESYEIETFEPYKPIAMANIWGMDEVLGDRCISITLEKSGNPIHTKILEDFENNPNFNRITKELIELVAFIGRVDVKEYIKEGWNSYIREKYGAINLPSIHTIRTIHTIQTLHSNNTRELRLDKIYSKGMTNEKEIMKEREELMNKIELEEIFNKIDNLNISGRNLELLFPLLLVAKMLSMDIFEETLKIGKELMEEKKADEYSESKDISVYEFISSLSLTSEFYPMKELVLRFRSEFGEEEWVNEKWFGRALKRLCLFIDKRKINGRTQVTLNIAKAKEKLKIFKSEEKGGQST